MAEPSRLARRTLPVSRRLDHLEWNDESQDERLDAIDIVLFGVDRRSGLVGAVTTLAVKVALAGVIGSTIGGSLVGLILWTLFR